jgi:hypothetical protein
MTASEQNGYHRAKKSVFFQACWLRTASTNCVMVCTIGLHKKEQYGKITVQYTLKNCCTNPWLPQLFL